MTGRPLRIHIWHGYLLSGTGSNEYTRALARTLARAGHEVIVFSQDPDPDRFDLGGARAVRPSLTGRLPVFVLDRYANAEPIRLPDMPRSEADDFVAAQVAALQAAGPADLLITNHALLGGPVGAGSGLPWIVKVHGSELEYAMRGNPGLCRWAAQTLPAARAVVVGSEHIGRVVTELIGLDPALLAVVPPGVDIEQMAPQDRTAALRDLLEESAQDLPNHGDERLPDPGNVARLRSFLGSSGADGTGRPTVAYVGKLSREKGVHLLLEALVGVDARAVVVGFGPARAELEQQAASLGLECLFTGPLQHRHLRHLWALADVSVVPSVFPEAFGMVAAESAATGCPPFMAGHSGLAEVAAGIEASLPHHLRILTFRSGDSADLSRGLRRILALGPADRSALAAGCRAAVASRWSWDSVATRMLDVGGLGELM